MTNPETGGRWPIRYHRDSVFSYRRHMLRWRAWFVLDHGVYEVSGVTRERAERRAESLRAAIVRDL